MIECHTSVSVTFTSLVVVIVGEGIVLSSVDVTVTVVRIQDVLPMTVVVNVLVDVAVLRHFMVRECHFVGV